jgi:DNA-directed RNA polymerase specialized sigma24 family protein
LLPLDDELAARTDERDEELVAVDLALERLARVDARKARVVELMFFGGLTLAETAHELGVSLNTVKRDWSFAKLWILRETPGLAVGG